MGVRIQTDRVGKRERVRAQRTSFFGERFGDKKQPA